MKFENISDSNNHLSNTSFQIGDCLVSPDSGNVKSGEQNTRLEPKAMDVLVYLANHAGQVVTRTELEENVWKGTVVSYEALTVTINKIRRALNDNSRKPEYIETLSKKGYRLISPVSFSDNLENISVPVEEVHSTSGYAKPLIIFLGLLIFIGIAGYFLYGYTNDLPINDSSSVVSHQQQEDISIAVIPFANNSGDADQDYFAYGMTEYLITDLSRLSSLTVISRTSILGYSSKTVNIQDVSNDLNVRYVLTGSVQINVDKMRVSVQLADAYTNTQIWGDHYDRKMDDIFLVQDEITQQIVLALVSRLGKSENSKQSQDYASLVLQANKLKQSSNSHNNTSSIEAYDNYIRGNALYISISKEGNTLARKMFQRAIDVDPKFAAAYSAIALTHIDDYRRKWVQNPVAAVDRAFEYANKAIDLDNNAAVAHWVLAYANLYGRKLPEQAIEAAEQAIMLYPNYADAYAIVASAYSFIGRSVDAIRINKHAMRLNPNSSFVYYANLGRDYYFIGDREEAVKHLKSAIFRNENYLNAHLYLAATYASLDQIEEASWEVEQVQILDPEFSLNYWASIQPYTSDHRRGKLVTDLIKAGLPR